MAFARPEVPVSTATNPSSQLRRGVSSSLLFFFVIGDILGSGIYAMVGLVAGRAGGLAWLSFALAVLFAVLTAFSYAELVTKYPKAAGASLYVSKAFKSDFFSFLVTFCLLAAGLSAIGSLAQVFGGRYFQEFLQVPSLIVAAVFVLMIALINFRGITESMRANLAMSLLELSGLLIIIGIGIAVLVNGQADLSRPFQFSNTESPWTAVLGGATLAFFAVIGFENAANLAEEAHNPTRAFPRALLGGILLAGLLYVAVSFIAAMVVPIQTLAGSTGPLLEVVKAGPLPLPGWLFSLIALVAVTNTALAAHIMVSRVMYGMANEGVLPRVFSLLHPERRTPWVSIVFATVVVMVLMLTADLARLADTTVVFILMVFILVNVSLIKLRRDRVEHQHFQAPIIIPYLAIAACLLILSQQSLGTWLYAGAVALVGAALYVVNVSVRRRFDQKKIG
jgi:basic amino acid/polyamine antiporter, APA family